MKFDQRRDIVVVDVVSYAVVAVIVVIVVIVVVDPRNLHVYL